MITRDEKYMPNGMPSEKLILGAIQEYDKSKGNRAAMRDYYDGKHEILHRVKTAGASNHRVVTNHAKYIVDLASAYLIGSPVSYADDKQKEQLQRLTDAYKAFDVDSVDAELAKHAGIYGAGVELLYTDSGSKPRSAAMDPVNSFVVYDDTVEHKPLLGVRRHALCDELGQPKGYAIYVHTEKHTIRYGMPNEAGNLTLEGAPVPHYFGGVPLVEYWNNEDEKGDFAHVITLIDAYNLLLSDRLNDKEQLVNALLMVSGFTFEEDEGEYIEQMKRMREHRVLEMPPIGAKAEYLIKQLQETEVQVLAETIERDIHKIAMVPAMTDEDFAGQASGVAMKFKLLGLEQLTRTKERWFREGLRSRLRMFANILSTLGKPKLDAETIQITMTRGLPVNELEQSQIVQNLRDIAPVETLLRLLPFIDDPKAAKAQADKERQEAEARRMGTLEKYDLDKPDVGNTGDS